MFDRIIDTVIEFIELFQCFVFVDEFEAGVVMRRGIYNRPTKPGFNWILPMAQEDVLVVNIKPEPMYLDVQSLHTADEFRCNVQIGLVWRIIDPKVFIVDNEDTENLVGMLASGVVADSVEETKWKDMKGPGWRKALKAPINRLARKRGVEVDEVVKQDFAEGTANRLWHEGISISVADDE